MKDKFASNEKVFRFNELEAAAELNKQNLVLPANKTDLCEAERRRIVI